VNEILAALLGYLLGSIPFGLILTRNVGVDIRSIGSGNIGATNVLRTGRKGLALATLLLDGGKGAVAVLVARWIDGSDWLPLAAGVGAVFGHNFPVWLKFKGGKGVATTLGMMLAAQPAVGLVTCVTWAVVFALSRISSLAALISLALSPLFAMMMGAHDAAVAFLVLAVLGWIRHRANLKRLAKGEEPRIGAKPKAAEGK